MNTGRAHTPYVHGWLSLLTLVEYVVLAHMELYDTAVAGSESSVATNNKSHTKKQ